METAINDFITRFLSILWEAMPFIVVGAILAGVLEEMLPQRLVARILPRSRFLAIAIGGLLGLIFPMCECGIVPVMRRLIRKGLPLSCCTAYLLAGPIINVVVILSTMVAFSGTDAGLYLLSDKSISALRDAKVPDAVLTKLDALKNKNFKNEKQFLDELAKALDTGELKQYQSVVLNKAAPSSAQLRQTAGQFSSLWMTILRVGLGYVIAVTTSLIVDHQYRKYGNDLLTPLARPSPLDDNDDPERKRSAWKRLSNITETALSDFIDITAFLILGSLLAASIRVGLDHDTIARMSHQHIVWAILIMMALAILLCLCSEADAFFAASFVELPSAAKLAFLVLGPMMDLKLYMLYTRVFRPRLIATIFGAVMVQVFIWSLVVHYIWQAYKPSM